MCKECRQRPPNQLKINDRNIEALSKPNANEIPAVHASATGSGNVPIGNATGVQGQGSSNIPQPRRAATNQPQTTSGAGMTHKQNQPQSQRNSRLENRPSLCRQQSECSEGNKKDENTKFRINQRTRIMLEKNGIFACVNFFTTKVPFLTKTNTFQISYCFLHFDEI